MTRKTSSNASTTHIALLRGINVGGKHILPMSVLKSIFEQAGCANVRTYIQSGNVIFDGNTTLAKSIQHVAAQRIEKQFGFRPPIIVRSSAEWARLIKINPFLREGVDIKMLHAGFLDVTPAAKLVAGLDLHRSPGDRFEIRGREIFLHLPHGMADSKLTNAYFDAALKSLSTFRNWRTVLKLAEIARASNTLNHGEHGGH